MSRLTAALLGGVVGIGVIALVVLTLGHNDTAQLLGFLAPVVAVLLVLAQGGRQEATLAQHTDQLATITHQTNGVLSQRIADAVSTALDNHPALQAVADSATAPVADVAQPGG